MDLNIVSAFSSSSCVTFRLKVGRPGIRSDPVPGRKASDIILGGLDRYLNPTAFSIQPAGFLGTADRKILEDPSL